MLVIPDLHCDSDHPKAIDWCRKVQEQFKTDKVIQLGDEIDAATFSVKWSVSPDGPSPSRELELAIESLKHWQKAFPEMSVLESNHGIRIFKKALVNGIPSRVLRRYEEILEFPKGWKLVGNKLEVDEVMYVHGEMFNGSSWMSAHNRMRKSVVCGHIHSRAGVSFSRTTKQLWSMNSGCMINPLSPAFDYAKNSIEKAIIGCSVVIDGETPIFMPMPEKWVSYE